MLVGAVPMAYGAVPMLVGAVPVAYGAVPTLVRPVPVAYGAVPQVLGTAPEAAPTTSDLRPLMFAAAHTLRASKS
jgi:hypothetical protein